MTTFSDTFDGPAGAAVDSSKWQIETGDNVNNHERQYYTAGNRNAALDGQGHLVITARRENPAGYQCWYGTCQYTSARLNTSGRFTAQYGHVEARMRIPRGQGMWPAFWMLGDDIGQVGCRDQLRMFDAGASLIQIYTSFIYEGPGVIGRINRALARHIACQIPIEYSEREEDLSHE